MGTSAAAWRTSASRCCRVLQAFALRHEGRFAVVCTAGWPAHVALELLDRLGAPLAYHG